MAGKNSILGGSKASVLIVDDDAVTRSIYAQAVRSEGDIHVAEADDGAAAKVLLEDRAYDVVVTDLSMPVIDGLSLMQWAQKNHPGSTWIILSGTGTFDTAVKAVRLGAFDFLCKPMDSVNQLLVAVRNALRQRQLEAEKEHLHGELEDRNARLKEQVAKLEEACHRLCEQADVINDDLHRAELIQRALLPQSFLRIGGCSLHAVYRACQHVGGDTYGVQRVDRDHVALCIADAAGHGVSAAMLAVLFKNRLHWFDDAADRPFQPRDVLNRINRDLVRECRAPGLFVTAACALLNTRTRRLTLASAGHPPLLLRRSQGGVEWFHHNGPALGLAPDAEFAQCKIDLRPGDRMLFYTDGLLNQPARDAKSLMDRIPAALAEKRTPGHDVLSRILGLASGPQETGHPEDDITLMLLEVSEAPSSLDNGLPTPAHEVRELPSSQTGQILAGSSADGAVMSIQGRMNWTLCPVFLEQCQREMKEGRPLLLEVSLCTYADSTALGTIQEVTTMAHQQGVTLRIHGMSPAVRGLFEELEMSCVLERTTQRGMVLPRNMAPLTPGPANAEQNRRRILLAHEALSSLNELNRSRFAGLIELLNQELKRSATTES